MNKIDVRGRLFLRGERKEMRHGRPLFRVFGGELLHALHEDSDALDG